MRKASLTKLSAISFLRLHALAASQRLLAFGRRRRRLHPHLLLELLQELVGADLLRLFRDLHPLRVDVRHGHFHARFEMAMSIVDTQGMKVKEERSEEHT